MTTLVEPSSANANPLSKASLDVQGGDVAPARTEKLAYGLGLAGGAVMMTTISAFLLIFFTDVFGLHPAAVGTLFLVARLVDAVNDPLMGYLMDHAPETRWGRFRPILLVGGVLAAVNFVLLFLAPDFSQAGKLIWAYAIYLLFGFTYDLVAIPGTAFLSRMTRRTSERDKLAGINSIVGIIGYIVVYSATIPLVRTFADPRMGWRVITGVYAVVSLALTLFMVARVRERVRSDVSERYSLRKVPAIIFGNGPLMVLLGAFLCTGIAPVVVASSAALFYTYNVGMPNLIAPTGLVAALFMVLASAFFPRIARALGRRRTYLVFGAIGVFGALLYWVVPPTNIPLLFVLVVLYSVGYAAPAALNNSLLADSTDYAEYKNGIRSEGAPFAARNFATKLVQGLGGALQGYVLAAVGYVPNAPQTQQALNGILHLRATVPAVSIALATMMMMFYPLTEERFAHILDELRARRLRERTAE